MRSNVFVFPSGPYLELYIALNMDYPALTPEMIEYFLRQGRSNSTLEGYNTIVSLHATLVGIFMSQKYS